MQIKLIKLSGQAKEMMDWISRRRRQLASLALFLATTQEGSVLMKILRSHSRARKQ